MQGPFTELLMGQAERYDVIVDLSSKHLDPTQRPPDSARGCMPYCSAALAANPKRAVTDESSSRDIPCLLMPLLANLSEHSCHGPLTPVTP